MLSARAIASNCRCAIESDSTRGAAPQAEAHLFQERTAETVDGAAGKAEIADDDVLAGGEAREEVEFLMDDADAEALRIARIGDVNGLAVDGDPRGIGGGGAGENPGKRAFAGAVFADQGMDFARA